MDSNSLQDDLAAAVRKSWSESQHTAKKQTAYLADSGHSPISTPVPEVFEEASIHSFHAMNSHSDSASMHSDNSSDPAFKKPFPGADGAAMAAPTPVHTAPAPVGTAEHAHAHAHVHEHSHHHHGADYQLFKHHYSISDDHRDSVVEILNDLELESPEPPVLSSVPENTTSARDRSGSVSKKSTTTRRGSIQDVQWIRQLLNPRSSFSGNSANEPPVHYGARGAHSQHQESSPPYSAPPDSKCWVTVLPDDSIEAVKSIIVLSESMRLVRSAYPLYVIHDHKINMSRLRNYNISSIPVSLEDFASVTGDESDDSQRSKRLVLSLFVDLVDAFDLVCYIAPTCMVVENIDELLSSAEICNEIDNETCVLLTNVCVGDDEPQLMLLKPNREVSMCIKEYFTIYGDGDDHAGKVERLRRMDDLAILRELFHDTWGQISSEGYVSILQHDVPVDQGHAFTKIADFKYLRPWSNKIQAGDNTYCGRWYRIWNEFYTHVS
ncbi:Ids2 protein [Maudiozyma humilis]|uniref:Ids2 protein n=1 Tax=Maudiozyma humilis TaxID=51915 RepID=A0AAV5S447_MAUHU|nr:Ids2 protein [Kazachstania humilis]